MKTLSITLIAILFSCFGLKAQDDNFSKEVYAEGDQLWGLSYNIGFPNGEFRNFIKETSFRGFNLDYEYLVRKNLSVGFNAAYTLHHETNERASYDFEGPTTGVTVSAKVWRYTHLVPLHLTSRFYFSPVEYSWAHLFGGLGMGITYINQEVWVGMQTFREENWRFSMAPEVGFDFSTDGLFNIQISTQYLYIPNGMQLINENDLESWNLRVGFKKWIN